MCLCGNSCPCRNNAKATLNQTGLDKDWTSPESEFGWVLWTTGSVLVSALSLHSQSRPHPQLHPHPWSRLDPTRGPLLSETSADVLALMLSPREKTIQWSTTKTGIFGSHFHWEHPEWKSSGLQHLPVPRPALPFPQTGTKATAPHLRGNSWKVSHQTAQSQSTNHKQRYSSRVVYCYPRLKHKCIKLYKYIWGKVYIWDAVSMFFKFLSIFCHTISCPCLIILAY